MIYITQLIYIKEGQEAAFLKFEETAIPLMEVYGGRMLYRLRPVKDTFISATGELPYEIHLVSFESEEGLEGFLKDPARKELLPLKEQAIRTSFLFKGEKM